MANWCMVMQDVRDRVFFLLPEYGSMGGIRGDGPSIPLRPFPLLQAYAATGYELYIILTASADTNFGNDELWFRRGVQLRQATIDPHQSIQLFIDIVDFSKIFFYRIPSPWRE